MRFRRDAPATIIATAVVVISGMAVVSNRLFASQVAAAEDSQFGLMQSIVEFNLQGAENRALALAESLASVPALREAFAARDRARLLADYGPLFAVLREKHGIDQAQFHEPPAMSFLRLHAPDQHGDDLSRFRPLVVAVNRDQVARKGLAIARSGPAVFGVVPVRDAAGRPVGSFEVGLDIGGILDRLKEAYGLELQLLVLEQPLRDFAKGVDSALLAEENRVGTYVRFHSTHADLLRTLVDASRVAGVTTPTRYVAQAQGVTYGVVLVPVRNAAGEPLGVVAAARDFSPSRAASGRTLVWEVALAALGVILLSGVVLIVIRGFLLRPLAELTARVAEGSPAVTDDAWCEELQALARQCDRPTRPPGDPA